MLASGPGATRLAALMYEPASCPGALAALMSASAAGVYDCRAQASLTCTGCGMLNPVKHERSHCFSCSQALRHHHHTGLDAGHATAHSWPELTKVGTASGAGAGALCFFSFLANATAAQMKASV